MAARRALVEISGELQDLPVGDTLVGAAATLQAIYDLSIPATIGLAPANGPLEIRDNATPLGTALLQVANNAGTPFARVSATGVDAGTTAGNVLVLSGSGGSPDKGRVHSLAPIEVLYDTASNTTPAETFAIRWRPAATLGSYVGGCLSVSPNFLVTNGLFIPSTFSSTSLFRIAASPTFAATTFINYLDTQENSGNFPLVNVLAFNMGVVHRRVTSGTSTVTTTIGLSFAAQSSATVSGAVVTKTTQSAVSFQPTFNTVSGSTVNLGTMSAVSCVEPAVILFGSGLGTNNMTAYYGLNFPDMTFGGASAAYSVVRSQLNSGTNKWCIDHTGTAQSRMGGTLNFTAPLVGVQFGATGNILNAWSAAGFLFWQFNATSAQLRWSNPTTNRFLFDTSMGNTLAEYNWNCRKFSVGAQVGAVGNQKGVFVAGAETVTVGGEYSQYLLTQGANDTINSALTLYAGWTINAPSPTIGTGSVVTGVALNVGGNPSSASTNRIGVRILSNPTGGSGINAALWVTAGRSRFDGFVDINKPVALGGGLPAVLGTIGGAGPTAAAQAQWVQIEVNGVNHWIPAWT